MSSSKYRKPQAGRLRSNLRSNTQEEEMLSDEANPNRVAFLPSTEDVEFVGQVDLMAVVGGPANGLSISTIIKRDTSDDEEIFPVVNLKMRDPRAKTSIWVPIDHQIQEEIVHQIPAEEPEIEQVPGAGNQNRNVFLFKI